MPPTVELTDKAYRMLVNAKRSGETLSDTIARNPEIRKANLQKRGEIDIVTLEGKKLKRESWKTFALEQDSARFLPLSISPWNEVRSARNR